MKKHLKNIILLNAMITPIMGVSSACSFQNNSRNNLELKLTLKKNVLIDPTDTDYNKYFDFNGSDLGYEYLIINRVENNNQIIFTYEVIEKDKVLVIKNLIIDNKYVKSPSINKDNTKTPNNNQIIGNIDDPDWTPDGENWIDETIISDNSASNINDDITTENNFIPKRDSNKDNSIVENEENIPSPIKQQDHRSAQKTSNDRLRIALWNVANFGDKASEPKPQAIASIIFTQKYDVVGLIELDSTKVISRLVNYLNVLEQKNNTNNLWDFIYKELPVDSKKNINVNGDKAAAYIYNKTKVVPEILNNSQNGIIYDNSNFQVFKGAPTLNAYSRAPYIGKFRSNVEGYKNVNFTLAISHFDGPGVKTKIGEESFKGMGSREYNEAKNIKNVFDWVKKLNGNDDDLIFMGDTNIPSGKESIAFDWVSEYGAIMPLGEGEEALSSLKTEFGNYANPYDKIVHKSNLKFENAKVYKLYSFVDDPSIFQWAKITSLDDWVKYYKKYKSYSSMDRYVYSGVSDHSPISYDLILDPNDPY
ncbi:endonuclease/exonuclease/phosphatase family protein [Mycoplasma zalophidermidis]|uniref:endonuclease/exonuclease/phosphatase family protein n=1 Tax=Mycoplasma zalophidermidis TaxID=398174 RepID=UPI00215CABA5|nr:endonuclease/exonuclease/phosphatase family protein [Mycoplasma zalophidermidis]MCR8966268.1 endonuclease/exonuclease/phosphatase family protein [Mycoplasma zalophidermidis]